MTRQSWKKRLVFCRELKRDAEPYHSNSGFASYKNGSPLPFSKGEEGGEGLFVYAAERSRPAVRRPLTLILSPQAGERRDTQHK